MKLSKLIEYLLPSLVAWFTNRRIREESEKKSWEESSDYWKEIITIEKMRYLEKAVNDLYLSETQRKETIESKAASLFEAIGFAVSLVSVAVLFIEKEIASIIFVIPLGNFILAAICSWKATKIGEFFLPTLDGIKENLTLTNKEKNEPRLQWVIEKLVSIEMNCPIILIKSNWLAAAYQHFLLGIVSIILFFGIIIFEPYFMLVWKFLDCMFTNSRLLTYALVNLSKLLFTLTELTKYTFIP